jgi:hypothetical protein
MPMRLPRFSLAELMLAIVFVGVFAALAVRTWGGFFFLQRLAIAGVLLFYGYLLLVIVRRQHRERREVRRGGPD